MISWVRYVLVDGVRGGFVLWVKVWRLRGGWFLGVERLGRVYVIILLGYQIG